MFKSKLLSIVIYSFVVCTSFANEINKIKRHNSPFPVPAAGVIIEKYDDNNNFEGIIIIERGKHPLGLCIPIGKVENGETVEQCARREMQEEINVENLEDLTFLLFYDNPDADPRGPAIQFIYTARTNKYPVAGDDAALAFVKSIDEIKKLIADGQFVFHQEKIFQKYFEFKKF